MSKSTKSSIVHKTCPTWGETVCGRSMIGTRHYAAASLRWEKVTCASCLKNRPVRADALVRTAPKALELVLLPHMESCNLWNRMVGHRDCIFPCSGHPVLRTSPGKVAVGADHMPAYLSCSECGCTPLPGVQPTLVARYLRHFNRAHDELHCKFWQGREINEASLAAYTRLEKVLAKHPHYNLRYMDMNKTCA